MLTINASQTGRNWAQSDRFGNLLSSGYVFTTASGSPPNIIALYTDLGVAPQEKVQLPSGDCAFQFNYILRKQSPGSALTSYTNVFRYRYFRQGGNDVNCQLQGDIYEPGGASWRPWTNLLRAGNELSLDQAFFNLRPMFAELRNTLSATDYKEQVPGNWEILQEQFAIDISNNLVSLGSPRLVATLDYRFLIFENVVRTPTEFDPDAEDGFFQITADLIARPVGWSPASPMTRSLYVAPGNGAPVVDSLAATQTLTGPDANGKISSFSYTWDGRDSLGKAVEGTFNAPLALLGTHPGISTGNLWIPLDQQLIVKKQKCECEVTKDGTLQLSMGYPMQNPPVGPSCSPQLSYTSGRSSQGTASMGYGWKAGGEARLTVSGSKVFYRNESQQSMSWTQSGANYLPTEPENYVELKAVTGNPSYDFELTFQNQSKRRFLAGKLVQDVDRNDNVASYVYFTSGPQSGRLEKIVNGIRETRYDYDTRTDGQVRYFRSFLNGVATGRVIEMQYYASNHPVSPNRLQTIIDSAGETQSFEYDETGKLAAILDARNLYEAQYLYDAAGRIAIKLSYDQLITFYRYDLNNTTLSAPTSRPAGNPAITGYNTSGYNYTAGQLPSGAAQITHTAHFDLELNPGYRTLLAQGDLFGILNNLADRESIKFMDLKGNVIRVDEVYNRVVNPGSTPQLIREFNSTRMQYADSANPYLMTQVLKPNGSGTNLTYNARGFLRTSTETFNNATTVYDYTEDIDTAPIPAKRRNLVRKITRPAVAPQPATVIEMNYDANGNLTTLIDPRGKTTTLAVAANGQVNSITDRLGAVTSFTYDGTTLNLTEVIAPSDLNPTAPGRKVRMGYDVHDNVTSVMDDLNQTVSTLFDGMDRVTRVTDANSQFVEMTYQQGLLVQIDSPDNEGSGGVRRLTKMPLATNYDNAGRLLQVDAQKAAGNNYEPRVGYLYNGFSQMRSLLRLKDAVTKSCDYSYDLLGRLVNVNDFAATDTFIARAPYCSENTVTTPRGVQRRSVMDGLCRLTQIETQTERHLFTYDDLDRLVTARVGDRYANTPPSQSRQGARYGPGVYKHDTTYSYDASDRVAQILYPNNDAVSYGYDDEDRVTSVTDVHGKVTSYSYYNDGRLHTVTYAGQTFLYSYDAAGRLSQITYPTASGIVASFTQTNNSSGWDAKGQLLSLRYLKGGAEIQRFVYTYDNSGNRKTMTEVRTIGASVTTVNWAYTYDWFNRLLEVRKNGNLTSVYAYDESDNRIQLQWPQSNETWKYTYSIADRILKRERKVGAGAFADFETYTHDLDGNMDTRTLLSSGQTTEYVWDSMNRLRQTKVNSVVQQSTSYDHGGVRRLQADGAGKSKSFSSGSMSLCDTRPSGPVSFVQGHQLLGLEQGGNLAYFLTDGLGSVRLVVDSAGAVQGGFDQDVWGVPDTSVTPPGAELRGHSFIGGLGQRNEGGGLYYARQRWYDSGLGRWLSADPIGFEGSLNLYAYVENNPVGFVDPEGLYRCEGSPDARRLVKKALDRIRGTSEQAKALVDRLIQSDTLIRVIPPRSADASSRSTARTSLNSPAVITIEEPRRLLERHRISDDVRLGTFTPLLATEIFQADCVNRNVARVQKLRDQGDQEARKEQEFEANYFGAQVAAAHPDSRKAKYYPGPLGKILEGLLEGKNRQEIWKKF